MTVSSTLFEQQRGDEEARQHEEDRDTEVAGAARNADARVVRQHEEDGEPSQPVQPGPMPEAPRPLYALVPCRGRLTRHAFSVLNRHMAQADMPGFLSNWPDTASRTTGARRGSS
jgi:hypothetical protein